MDSLTLYFGIGVTALAATAILAITALRAFTGWLDLKRAEIERGSAGQDARMPSAVARIDIADLKERIRKLEAIAAGVDI